MVANTRKTPSTGSFRSVKPGTQKLAPPSPESVNQIYQSVKFRSLNLPVPIGVVENNAERPISVTLPLSLIHISEPTRPY